jgi:hypothetical protein
MFLAERDMPHRRVAGVGAVGGALLAVIAIF